MNTHTSKMNWSLVSPVLALAVIAGTFAFASPAMAQSGASLLLAPWQDGDSVELQADGFLQNRGDVREPGGESIRINTFEASGRFRFDPNQEHSPAVGFDVYHLELDHNDAGLPERLSDQSVGVAFGITRWDDWELGATVGFGFAGDRPYSDGDAWYATGNLVASRQLDERTTLQLALNYDGNRSILPDVPLPGFAWNRRASDTLSYTLGIPYNAVRWQPLPQLTLDARHSLLYTINFTATYDVVPEKFAIYGGFYNRYNGFHINDDDRNRRVFFQQRRIETGVNFTGIERWKLTAAVGYAFDQELRRGWDVRDLSTPTKFSSEPYLKLGFDVSF